MTVDDDIRATQRPKRADVNRVRCRRCGTPHLPLDVKADHCPSCAVLDDKTAAAMYRNARPRPGGHRGRQ